MKAPRKPIKAKPRGGRKTVPIRRPPKPPLPREDEKKK
jgi:hypothetical protein